MKSRKNSFARLMVIFVCASALAIAGCGRKEKGAGPREDRKPVPVAPVTKTPSAVSPDAGEKTSELFVVDVDGKRLTTSELDAEVEQRLALQDTQEFRSDPDLLDKMKLRLKNNITEHFITRAVLLNEVNRQDIKAGEEDVAKALNDMKSKPPAGMTFDDVLKRYGMTEEGVRERLQGELAIAKLLEMKTSDIPKASAEEIELFYNAEQSRFNTPETVRARHILIKCEPDADEAVKTEKQKLAEECRGKLLEGADFAVLAKEYSACPSKEKGGDLGEFTRGKMVKEFEDAAFSQGTNEIGPVVKTPFGLHIIQVLEHTPAQTKTMEEMRERISDFLHSKKLQPAIAAYVEELKKNAKVTYGGQ